MPVFYQTVADIFTDRKGQFVASYYVHELATEDNPVDSVESKGDRHTLRRSFRSKEQAKKFGRYLYSRYTQPNCLPPPTAHNLGLDLRMEIV